MLCEFFQLFNSRTIQLVLGGGIIHLGMKSFEVGYQIIRIINGTEIIAAEGKSVQVCFDYDTNKTIPIPDLWKQKVLAYEPSLKG